MALRSNPSNLAPFSGGTVTNNTSFPNGINVYSELIATNNDSIKYYKLARVRFISTLDNPNGTFERALFNIKLYHTGSNLKIGNIKGYFYNAPNKRNLHPTSFLMVINNSGSTGFSAGDILYFPLDSGSDANDYIVDIYLKVTNWAKLYENTESATFENGCTLTIKPDGSTLISSLPVAGTTTTIDSITYTYGASVNGIITSDLNSQTATTQNAIPKFADTAGQLVGSQKLSINASDQLVSTVTTGTAPMIIGSTTKVDNLNVSQINGFTDTVLMKTNYGYISNLKLFTQVGGDFNSNSSPATGTIKITLPQSWSNTMLNIKIKGYNHTTLTNAWELLIGGYTNSTTSTWSTSSASTPNNIPFTLVRLAHDGTKCCILLGTTTTNWSYPKIIIESVLTSNSATGWDTGYVTSLITDETGITVSSTPGLNSGVPIALTQAGQIIMNNNIFIQAKESGGSIRSILSMNTSNAVQVGTTTNATTINSTSTGLMHNNGTTTLNIVTEVTGTAAPTVTPNFAGQMFVDTTNKKIYVATGTTNSSDWTILN